MSQRTSLDSRLDGMPSFPEEIKDRRSSKRFSIFPPDYTLVRPAKNHVITVFVVALLIASMIAVIVGAFALMASQGALPAGLNSLSSLAAFGQGNSWCLIIGASTILLLSTWAFIAHQKRQAHEKASCPLEQLMVQTDDSSR